MEKKPVGHVDLPNSRKPVYPMDDLLLNYIYETKSNWPMLKTKTNIIINAYIQTNSTTIITPITSPIHVKTQYKHLINREAPDSQDAKITHTDTQDITYVEFQNDENPTIPIHDRSVRYFGIAMAALLKRSTSNRRKNKSPKRKKSLPTNMISDHIWLIDGHVPTLFPDKTTPFAHYTLKEETTSHQHPHKSSILYVNLQALAALSTPHPNPTTHEAIQLAQYLTGKTVHNPTPAIKQLQSKATSTFKKFKTEKEVVDIMSIEELAEERGEARGIEIGKAETSNLIKTMEENGATAEEILNALRN